MKDYDVIVVGGGPAGSTAARRAAQQGARVLLLDAASFPRPKPCGGALSEQAMANLDFAIDPRIIQTDVFGARVHFGDTMVSATKASRIGVLTRRAELDSYLLGKAAEAGVHVMDGTRVTGVSQSDWNVCVSTRDGSTCGKYVIAADGAQSVVATAVRPRLPRNQYAVTYEFDVACHRPDASEPADGLIDIYFGTAYMGYSWVFPKRQHWNMGVGALASQAPNVKSAAHEFFKRSTGTGGVLPQDHIGVIHNSLGWIVPVGGYRRPVAKGRVLLAGDAAGFVDPFSGEGIAYAIRSGAMAGILTGRDSIAPAGNAKRTRRVYERFCRASIDSDLRYGLLFARLLHAWPQGLLRLFSTNAHLLNRYLDVASARITYAEYVRWFLPRAAMGLLRMGAVD